MNTSTQLCLALDFPPSIDLVEILETIHRLEPEVDIWKVGPVILSHDPYFLHHLRPLTNKPIFLDNKYHDIPSTVTRAIESVAPLVDYVSVHAAGGKQMMTEAKLVGPKILAVLDLSSIAIYWETTPDSISRSLSHLHLVQEAGVHGIISSNTMILESLWDSQLWIVKAGIRLDGESPNDHQNTMTPQRAAQLGINCIVMGRSILNLAPETQITHCRQIKQILATNYRTS